MKNSTEVNNFNILSNIDSDLQPETELTQVTFEGLLDAYYNENFSSNEFNELLKRSNFNEARNNAILTEALEAFEQEPDEMFPINKSLITKAKLIIQHFGISSDDLTGLEIWSKLKAKVQNDLITSVQPSDNSASNNHSDERSEESLQHHSSQENDSDSKDSQISVQKTAPLTWSNREYNLFRMNHGYSPTKTPNETQSSYTSNTLAFNQTPKQAEQKTVGIQTSPIKPHNTVIQLSDKTRSLQRDLLLKLEQLSKALESQLAEQQPLKDLPSLSPFNNRNEGQATPAHQEAEEKENFENDIIPGSDGEESDNEENQSSYKGLGLFLLKKDLNKSKDAQTQPKPTSQFFGKRNFSQTSFPNNDEKQTRSFSLPH